MARHLADLEPSDREAARGLMKIPNVGPAMAADLLLLGIRKVEDLKASEPLELYQELCERTGARHDPCVLDTFMAVVDFSRTGTPRPWWHFTQERKDRKLLEGS